LGRTAITLQLTVEQAARLRSVAGDLKVSPEALAETAARDLLAQPDDAFVKLAQVVVEENQKRYGRLRAGPGGVS
jgi:hypothetical protein